MLSVLQKFDNKLAKFELNVVGILLLIMSVLAFTQVITRYCFFYSIVWGEEVTRYCMIFMTFFGASFAVSSQEHISIDMLSGVLKKYINIKVILNLIILIFSLFFIFYSGNLVLKTFHSWQLTPAIRVPMFYVYLIILISLVFMAFHSLIRVVSIKDKKENAKC